MCSSSHWPELCHHWCRQLGSFPLWSRTVSRCSPPHAPSSWEEWCLLERHPTGKRCYEEPQQECFDCSSQTDSNLWGRRKKKAWMSIWWYTGTIWLKIFPFSIKGDLLITAHHVISYAYIINHDDIMCKHLLNDKPTEIISKLWGVQDSFRSWRYVSRLFGWSRSCTLTVEDFQVVLISCKSYKGQNWKKCAYLFLLSGTTFAHKCPYPLAHSEVSHQGAGSWHPQYCIHSGT